MATGNFNLALAFRDGKISIRWLYGCIPGRSHRPQQWFDRLLKQAQRAPDEVKMLCRSEFFDGMRASDGKLTPAEALTLLTFNANHHQYRKIVEEIERVSGITLPVEPLRSRYEGIFAIQLEELLQDITPRGSWYEVTCQKKIGSYYVDFYIEFYRQELKKYVIEFDEESHEVKRHYLINDPKRDSWFRKYQPDITFIRVKSRESSEWLAAVRLAGELVSLEKCYAQCIMAAAVDPKARNLRITSLSSRQSYDAERNNFFSLLKEPKHRLRELRKLLDRLRVPYEGERVINVSKAKLPRK